MSGEEKQEKTTHPASELPKPITRREFAMGSMAVLGAYTSFSQEEDAPLSDAAKALKLQLSDEIKTLMDRRHILEEDIRRVIEHAEQTGLKLYQPGTSYFLSKLRISYGTFYVEYSLKEGAFQIHSVYSHRLSLPEE